MASARRIVVEFLGDARDLQRATGQVERSTSTLGGKLKKVGLIAGGALAAGTIVAGKALFDMAKAAAEDQKAQALLANQLRNSAGATDAQIKATEDWISAQGRALGVTDDELRPALARLVSATGDVEAAQRQARIAMDVSAGTGKSLEQVTTAIMKAQNGQVAGLARLGVNVKNAKGETVSFDEAMARMIKTHHGAAEAAGNTLSGKMQRLKLIFAETKEEIGAKLIPVLTSLADWFLDEGLPAITEFGGWIRDNLFPIFRQVAEVVKQALAGMRGDVDGNLGVIKDLFRDFVSIVRSLWALFGEDITRFIKSALTNIRQIVKGLLNVIGGIFKVFSAVLKGDWKKAWEGVKQILRGAKDVLQGLVRQLWNVVGTLTRAGIHAVVAAVKGIPGALRALGGKFLDAGKHLIGKLFDGLKALGSLAGNVSRGLMNAIIAPINSGINAVNDMIPNKIAIPKLPDIDLPDNPFPTIPGFAKGVRNFRGGLAVVGERGPELVNLPGGSDVIPNHRLGSALGGGPIVVQLKVGAKVLEQVLIEHVRSSGRPLQVRTLGP